MAPLCYGRHRSLPEIIQHAIWLYFRFTLSLPRCRGAAGRTRARYLLRNGAPMGAEVRPREQSGFIILPLSVGVRATARPPH